MAIAIDEQSVTRWRVDEIGWWEALSGWGGGSAAARSWGRHAHLFEAVKVWWGMSL